MPVTLSILENIGQHKANKKQFERKMELILVDFQSKLTGLIESIKEWIDATDVTIIVSSVHLNMGSEAQ